MRDALGAVQSVLVLGGGSDIGRAIVERLIEERCRNVVLAAPAGEDLSEVASALGTAGASVETVEWDTLDVDSHAKVLGDVFERHGDIDLVLAMAGILGDQARFEEDPVFAAKAAGINYSGLVSSLLVCADRMRRQGHGQMVVFSSVAGIRGRKDNFVYGSTKAGLDCFAQGLGDALAEVGIRVMVVRPGFVKTKMTAHMDAAPFSTTPEQVAQLIVDGLAKGKQVVWAPPMLQAMFTVFRFLPRPVWRKLSDLQNR